VTAQTHATALAAFDQKWLAALDEHLPTRLIFALVGLTRLGERPASIERLAAIADRPVDETAALVRSEFTARVEDGMVHWDTPFPVDRARRAISVGDREIPMNRCAALFVYAAVLDVPFTAKETCPTTGTRIRVDFVPGGYTRVDPPETVAAMLAPENLRGLGSMTLDQADDICVQMPFFASAEAAEPWLASHPRGRVFTVDEMFDRPIVTHYLYSLRPLIHSGIDAGPRSR
jgi:hypothetical protein